MADRDEREPASLWSLIEKVALGCRVANLHDASGQLDDRQHWICRARNRVYSEECRVRAHEIEVSPRIEENGGGAGQRRWNAMIKAAQFVEQCNLALVPRIVGP